MDSMQRRKSPFDRDPKDIPIFRFMLHASSLSRELMAEGSPAYRLVQMNSFREVEFISLPTQDDELTSFLNGQGIVTTQYYSQDNSIALKGSDCSQRGVTHRITQNIWEPLVSGSVVTQADALASRNYDYLVVGDNEESLKEKTNRTNIITAEQALEKIRIFFIAHSIYHLPNEIPIGNEDFYYLYRFKKLYPEYQYAWTVAAYTHEKTMPDKLFRHLLSLDTRLNFVCQAYDKIAYLSLKSANYIEQNQQLYHLAFFIMLVTGIYDSLAHVIAAYYKFPLKGRMDIGIRIPIDSKNNRTKKFFELLKNNNSGLYDFLTEDEFKKNINIIYPLRDSFQHREFPHGVMLEEMSELPQNVYEIYSDTANEIVDLRPNLGFLSYGKHSFIYPLPLIEWAQRLTITVVNKILSSLDWGIFYSGLPEKTISKIDHSHEELRRGVWYLLNLPEEPLYF